jgi:hypothetical protein
MQDDRAAFIKFFGGDELVLPPAEAADRLDACHRHRRQAELAAHPGRCDVAPTRTCPHPETADAVFRKVLRKPGFTWADHGEALLRRRKAWYYEREPRPGVSVIGARLKELTDLR